MLSDKGLGATGAGGAQNHGCQPGCVTGWQHGWAVSHGCGRDTKPRVPVCHMVTGAGREG